MPMMPPELVPLNYQGDQAVGGGDVQDLGDVAAAYGNDQDAGMADYGGDDATANYAVFPPPPMPSL